MLRALLAPLLSAVLGAGAACASDPERPLAGVDLADGAYVLYVQHPTYGSFLVRDPAVLAAHRDSLRLRRNTLRSLLPGEGRRDDGVLLFRDGALVGRFTGAAFSTFEVGALPQNGTPARRHYDRLPLAAARARLAEIAAAPDAYLVHADEELAGGGTAPVPEAELTIRFATVAAPTAVALDGHGYRTVEVADTAALDRLGRQLADCVRARSSPAAVPYLRVGRSLTTEPLVYARGGAPPPADPEGTPPRLLDFALVDFRVVLHADAATAAALARLPLGDCLPEPPRNLPALTRHAARLISASDGASEVVVDGFRESAQVGPAYPREFGISWVEAR